MSRTNRRAHDGADTPTAPGMKVKDTTGDRPGDQVERKRRVLAALRRFFNRRQRKRGDHAPKA
jgi:hypothetical protein